MPLQPGARLGPYEVVALIGAGGMGEVWLATELRLGRKVALKLLPPDLTRDPSRVLRFEQEARAASALNHPNVCTIYALAETNDGQHYIAMEYVEGETLRRRLTTSRLSLHKALDIAIQVAAALSAAHAAGIVHRDIKPENVMLRPDGLAKVLDFGLAKLASAAAENAGGQTTQTVLKTEAGTVVGTAAYMSPEQTRGQDVDARTDIWSLGVILYEMVAGRRPFSEPTSSDVLVAILDRDPAPLMQFEPHTPSELQRIVSKALRKDRERRYQLMKELRLDLESLREDLTLHPHAADPHGRAPGSGSTPSMLASDSTFAVAPSRDRRRVVAGAAVLVTAVLAGVGWWFWAGHYGQHVPPTSQPTVTRLTANPPELSVSAARISPDGRYVAYSDPTGIQVRVIDTGETRRMPDTQGLTVYAWTADATKVRAALCDQQTCTGWDVSILGGSRQPSGATWRPSVDVRASSDGSRLLTVSQDRTVVNMDLLDGAAPKPLIHLAGADFVIDAAWSADGSHVYFTRWSASSVIERIAASGGSPTPVFNADAGTQVTKIAPALPDGRLFAAIVRMASARQRSQTTALVEIHTAGPKASTQPRVLTEWGPDAIEQISASSDGSRIMFLRTTAQADVYVADFDAAHTMMTTPRRLTLDDRSDVAYAWTPDSATVVFRSNRNGTNKLFKQRLDSDVAEPLVQGPDTEDVPRVTSDGRWVLYTAYQPDKPTPRIMRVPLMGGRPEPLATLHEGSDGFCHCSFYGRCVFLEYSTGGFVVYALDPIRGKEQELVRLPLAPASNLTPDGEHLGYVVPQEAGIQNHIRIVSFQGEPSRELVVKNAVRLGSIDFFPTGGFFAQETASPRRSLLFVSAEGNARALWTPDQVDVTWAIPSPDGKHLAISALARQSNVWLADQR